MAAKNPGSAPRRTRKAASVQTPVASSSPATKEKVAASGLEEEIRRRAYEIYLERGSIPGNESEDWLVAEREVRARAAVAGHSA